ncbi:MAG: class I SAM-dependent methyltransferase [Steroidobacteraceae bacterium]
MRFDLKLFSELNVEYKSKPLVRRPPVYKKSRIAQSGNRRAATLNSKYSLSGKRVVEIGCGRGETCRAIAKACGCEIVGIDIERYPHWEGSPTDGVTLLQADLSKGVPAGLGLFDFACSFAVWEHVRHPFAMLKAVHGLLKPGASFHFIANLYRGPKASHRYRQVYFPWPHLLFADEVFEDYYVSIGQKPQRAAWVNQLSIADYFRYFDMVGFECRDVRYDMTPIDEPFYQRFEDKLSRFPRFDLERDFIHATLTRGRRSA